MSIVRIISNKSLWVAGCAVATLTGCATTGDPNQGGLFGWSAAKADQRAAVYRAEFQNENRRLESEEITAGRLARQERSQQSRISDVNAELSLMLSDVQRIEASGEPSLVKRTTATKTRIQRAKESQNPNERELAALRRDVDLLREEMRLLQQR